MDKFNKRIICMEQIALCLGVFLMMMINFYIGAVILCLLIFFVCFLCSLSLCLVEEIENICKKYIGKGKNDN